MPSNTCRRSVWLGRPPDFALGRNSANTAYSASLSRVPNPRSPTNCRPVAVHPIAALLQVRPEQNQSRSASRKLSKRVLRTYWFLILGNGPTSLVERSELAHSP